MGTAHWRAGSQHRELGDAEGGGGKGELSDALENRSHRQTATRRSQGRTHKQQDWQPRAGIADGAQTGECENGRERKQRLPLLLPRVVHAPSAQGARLPPTPWQAAWPGCYCVRERMPPCLALPEAIHKLQACRCLKTSPPAPPPPAL